MALGLGNIGGTALSWLSTVVFWLGIILFIVIVLFGYIIFRKHKKLQYPCLEVIDIGGGKMGFIHRKAGWFKTNWFMGLIDYGGQEVLMLKDRRTVQCASSEDFHDINGRRGLIVQRKPDDPRVLLPISKITLSNNEMFNQIAPADYRDTSVKLMNRAESETMGKLAQYLPIIGVFLGCMVLFLAIMFILQYVKSSQTEAWSNVLESMKMAKNSGAVASTTAPLFFLKGFFGGKDV